jgi:hypothetical protein
MSGRLCSRVPSIGHLAPASTAGTASIGLAVPAWPQTCGGGGSAKRAQDCAQCRRTVRNRRLYLKLISREAATTDGGHRSSR